MREFYCFYPTMIKKEYGSCCVESFCPDAYVIPEDITIKDYYRNHEWETIKKGTVLCSNSGRECELVVKFVGESGGLVCTCRYNWSSLEISPKEFVSKKIHGESLHDIVDRLRKERG